MFTPESSKQSSKTSSNSCSSLLTSGGRFTWKTQVDSKGRVTIPARIRNRLNLSENEEISLSLQSRKVVRKEVENEQEAVQILSKFDSVESFQYSEGILEIVTRGEK